MKNKINILGYEYKIYFVEKENWKFENCSGKINYRERTIHVRINRWFDNNVFMEHETLKTLWHEVGHGIYEALPTSIIDEEWTAVCGEEFFKLLPQLEKIKKDLRKVIK